MTADMLRELAKALREHAQFTRGVLVADDMRQAARQLERDAAATDRMETATPDTIHHALTEPDTTVGPACINVPVPDTIDRTDHFREIYSQGYRHALNDVRAYLDSRPAQLSSQVSIELDDVRWAVSAWGSTLRDRHAAHDPFETCKSPQCTRQRKIEAALKGIA